MAKLQAAKARNREVESKPSQEKAEAEALAAAAISQKEQETAALQHQIDRERSQADNNAAEMFRQIAALQAQMALLSGNNIQHQFSQAHTINLSQNLNIHANTNEFLVVQNFEPEQFERTPMDLTDATDLHNVTSTLER
jgi:hypothetical protein